MNSPTYRHFAIRTVVSIAGDIAAGVAVATACTWIIETAALGLFLSFLIWLLGLVISLALSQYVVHPTLAVVLSDDKLDRGIAAASRLWSAVVTPDGIQTLRGLWPGPSKPLRRKT